MGNPKKQPLFAPRARHVLIAGIVIVFLFLVLRRSSSAECDPTKCAEILATSQVELPAIRQQIADSPAPASCALPAERARVYVVNQDKLFTQPLRSSVVSAVGHPFHFVSLGMDVPMVITDYAEEHVRSVFVAVLPAVCSDPSRSSLVLDFGMNMGYYSLFSAALGCRVATAEPQELCHALMNVSLVVNGFESRVRTYRNILWHEPRTIDIPLGGCDGGFHATPSNQGSTVSSITLTQIIEQAGPIDRLPLMKLDVEGAEIGVLLSGKEHIWGSAKPRIENFVIEVAPSRWQNVGTTIEQGKETFRNMLQSGYKAYRFGGSYQINGVGLTEIADFDGFLAQTAGENIWMHLPGSV